MFKKYIFCVFCNFKATFQPVTTIGMLYTIAHVLINFLHIQSEWGKIKIKECIVYVKTIKNELI